MTEKAEAAKKFLGRSYWSNIRIDGMLRQAQRLRDASTRITQQFGGECVSHSRDNHSMENTIVKLIDLEQSLDCEIDALVDTQKVISDVINAVADDTDRLILELRYKAFLQWPEIETLFRMHRSKIFKHHARALETVYGIIEEKGLVDSID